MIAFVDRLAKIKTRLEQTRRFGLGTLGNYRRACAQAEGDLEELLIDYGFLTSEDREADSDVLVEVDHQVHDGSIYGPYKNRDLDTARTVLAGAYGAARLVRVTTITETLERKSK